MKQSILILILTCLLAFTSMVVSASRQVCRSNGKKVINAAAEMKTSNRQVDAYEHSLFVFE